MVITLFLFQVRLEEYMQLKASAPGSLMLLGEFAVLQGRQALVCAIDKRLFVTLTPRNDMRIEITADALGHYSTEISQLQIRKPFQFVLAALQYFKNHLKQGCDISIESEFSATIGFGSSAAVTVATLAALLRWFNMPCSPLALVKYARDVVRNVQGLGSGADVAASVYGGLVSYNTDLSKVEKYSVALPINAIYAGYKTPTAQVIQHVLSQFATEPAALEMIYTDIGFCVQRALRVLPDRNWRALGNIMNEQQLLMQKLGVSSSLLQGIVSDLCQHTSIYGAKISGSGMGDCVIGLGKLSDDYTCVVEGKTLQRIPVVMTLHGVHSAEI